MAPATNSYHSAAMPVCAKLHQLQARRKTASRFSICSQSRPNMLQKMSHLQTVPTFHSQLNQLSKQLVFGTVMAIPEVEDGPKPQRGACF
jgi:hypothetical protein